MWCSDWSFMKFTAVSFLKNGFKLLYTLMSGVCPHLCEYATECQETHQSHVEHLPELKYEITEKRKKIKILQSTLQHNDNHFVEASTDWYILGPAKQHFSECL